MSQYFALVRLVFIDQTARFLLSLLLLLLLVSVAQRVMAFVNSGNKGRLARVQ